jgi:aldose sugar dehydrogenase
MIRAIAVLLLAVAATPLTAQVFDTSAHKIRIVTLAEGLSNPWSIAFLPGGDMLVTERTGGLRLIKNGVLLKEPIAGTPAVKYRFHAGMMDVVLHPRFAENRLVYLTYAKPKDNLTTTALMRARFDGNSLVDAKDIFLADAWLPSDVNLGSRLVFDREGLLYMTLGERNTPGAGPTQGQSAQDVNNHQGKILRLTDDGAPAPGNPFAGKPGHRPEVYSYGHRNPQGITIHPQTNEVWASEHGPLGGDEVNIIKPGANYGWPLITFGRNYDGSVITPENARLGLEQPRFYWVPSIGITNILFYTGDRFPMWKGQLIVAGHGAMQVQRVRMEGRGTNEREPIVTPVLRRRFRDIRQGPDGLLYLVASDLNDQTPNSGVVLRIEPVS